MSSTLQTLLSERALCSPSPQLTANLEAVDMNDTL